MTRPPIPASPLYGAQRCTPVVRDGVRGTITHLSAEGWVVASDLLGIPALSMCPADVPGGSPADAGWLIDLDHHTGRVHTLEGVLRNEGYPDDLHRECTFRAIGDGWAIYRRGEYLTGWWREDASLKLDSLDLADDARLPDGSRAVDAHALAIVALTVLGGSNG
jgi:hypothetical protein